MSLVNIISAIGNNNSIYPLIVRDCGIEVPTKIAMTYNQNKEDKRIAWLGARERFIDEYAVSAVWLFSIPLIDKLGKKLISRYRKLNLNSDVNLKLITEEEKYNKNLKAGKKAESLVQGFEYNIKKFSDKPEAKEAIKDLLKVKNNKKLFENLMNIKFISSIAIPIALMGFVIPKLVFASTAKKMKEYEKQNPKTQSINPFTGVKDFDQFIRGKSKMTSFQGALTSVLTNLTTVQKMAVTDGGYAAGRIITARKKNEAIDLGFKFTGMMFLNFIAPKWIEKAFNKITDVNLDPKMFVNPKFLAAVKNNRLELPKSDSAKDLLEFIDNNPKALFTNLAAKFDKVALLENGIRDPRAYVDTKELAKFKGNIEKFAKQALDSGNIKAFTRKSLALRSFTILANIGLSSFLLAYGLPKAQFIFREWFTGSKLEPGLIDSNSDKK